MSQQSLLLTWFSPAFPIGAFAYSHGLEAAVEAGLAHDAPSLGAWLADLIEHGGLRNDLIILSQSFGAAALETWPRLQEVAELSAALQPSAERRLEAVTQGACFAKAIEDAWPSPLFATARVRCAKVWTYPVAAGIAAAAHSLELRAMIEAYALSFITNQTSAAIRLGVIGHTAAQQLIAHFIQAVEAAASRAASSSLDDLGSASFAADLCSMAHETQYTRLFRT